MNVLLAHKAKGSGVNTGRAAQGIACSAARELLGPLLDTACARLGFVLRRAFDIASERQHLLQGPLHSHVLLTLNVTIASPASCSLQVSYFCIRPTAFPSKFNANGVALAECIPHESAVGKHHLSVVMVMYALWRTGAEFGK